MATLATQRNSNSDRRAVRLTKNDTLVLNALKEAGAPLKAYDLLERLKVQGIGAPMTVYRALDRLQKQGLVHKLDVLGAFMVCEYGEPHMVETFLVCMGCEHVTELRDDDGAVEALARKLAAENGFEPDLIRLEMRGACAQCPRRLMD